MAALSVVAFHFLSAFRPGIVPDQSPAVPAWADSPFEVLLNGPFWVFVFFVLSGYVLAGASSKKREHFWTDVGTRYLRLALPATASVALAWLLLKLFPLATTQLDAVAPSRWVVQGHIPSILAALKDGLFGIFDNGYCLFNNVLWTMRIELIGSLGVYVVFEVGRRYIEAAAAVVTLALVVAGATSDYMAFALGACLSVVTRKGWRLSAWPALIVFATGLLLGSEGRGYAQRHGLGAWPVAFRPGEAASLLYPLGALAVVAGVLGSRRLQKVLESSTCKLLGRLSFPLYLVHVPLLYTVVAAAAVAWSPRSAPSPAMLPILALVFLFAAFALALVFDAVVDRPVLALNRRIGMRARCGASSRA